MTPSKHIITLLICLCLALLVLSGTMAQDNPPSASSGAADLNTLFGNQRLVGEDVVYFTNNDVLRGEVTTELLHLTTPYAQVLLPLRKCAGASFEDTDKAGETVVTINANRMKGILTDRFINIRLAGAGTDVPIRKERIRYILLRKSPLEVGFLNSPAGTDAFIMSNGDILTGKASDQGLSVRTDLSDITTNFSDIKEVIFQGSTGGPATIRKKSGEQISGTLQTEELSIQLDLGVRLDSISKDRFAKYSSGDGLVLALKESGVSSPPLPELPSEDDVPPPPPPPTETPVPSPSQTATATPEATSTPTLTATATPSGPVSNVFESEEHGFRIERPNETWRIITDPAELKELNEGAVVAFESAESIYSMVITEHLPQVQFDDYVKAVSPALENVELLSDERGTLTGLPARKRVWRGSSKGLPFRFFYTLVAKGDDRIQIVSWCAEATLTEVLVKQINALEDSFGPYQPPTATLKTRPRGLPQKGTTDAAPPR